MRDRFTVINGVLLVVLGLIWILDGPADLIDVPWEWVLPIAAIVVGIVLVVARSGGGGTPPSQFERDDAPRVP